MQQFARNHPGIEELSQLRDLISSFDSPAEFIKAELNYSDKSRAKSRAETLVGVIDYFLDVQQDHQGQTEAERLTAWAEWAKPGDYLTVSVRGFGVAGFQYLRMLCGAQATKPNVHIIRFVSRSLGIRLLMFKHSICWNLQLNALACRFGSWIKRLGEECAADKTVKPMLNMSGDHIQVAVMGDLDAN